LFDCDICAQGCAEAAVFDSLDTVWGIEPKADSLTTGCGIEDESNSPAGGWRIMGGKVFASRVRVLVSSVTILPFFVAFSLQTADFHSNFPRQQLLHQVSLLFLQRVQRRFRPKVLDNPSGQSTNFALALVWERV
jgi:hypothetical protein